MVQDMREFMPLARRNPQKRVNAIQHKLYLKLKHNLRLTTPQNKLKNEEMKGCRPPRELSGSALQGREFRFVL